MYTCHAAHCGSSGVRQPVRFAVSVIDSAARARSARRNVTAKAVHGNRWGSQHAHHLVGLHSMQSVHRRRQRSAQQAAWHSSSKSNPLVDVHGMDASIDDAGTVIEPVNDVIARPSPQAQAQNGVAAIAAQNGVAKHDMAADAAATTADATAATAATAAAASTGFVWRRRWTILALCFVAFMLCNMDRVNMSIAILPMSHEFGWDAKTVGLVQSSFFWGYLLTQVLGGVWADRFGGKRVLGFGVIWWSIATMLTPFAAKLGLPVLLAARACMGIGEGVAMPSMNNLLSRWIPSMERSRSLALVYSGMYTGSIIGLAASPHLIETLHWPSVFYGFGSLGLLWFAAWQSRAESCPQQCDRVSAEERDFIVAHTVEKKGGEVTKIPWRALLSRKEVWAIIVSHFCHNWGIFILLTYMPMYYNQVLGMDLARSGFASVLPWISMAVCANIGGWIADSMVARGTPVTRVRKIMQTIGFLGPACFLTLLSGITNPAAAVACMIASQGLDSFSQSGLYANHQDIGPRYAGVLLGMSNTAGVLAGVLSTFATGQILHYASWSMVWSVAVGFMLLGTVVWNLFSTGERIFD